MKKLVIAAALLAGIMMLAPAAEANCGKCEKHAKKAAACAVKKACKCEKPCKCEKAKKVTACAVQNCKTKKVTACASGFPYRAGWGSWGCSK